MRLLSFYVDGRLHLGVMTPAGVVDVAAAQAALGIPSHGLRAPETMDELLDGGGPPLEAVASVAGRATDSGPDHPWLLAEDGLRFGPCVPRPGKLFLVGRNYLRHAAETGGRTSDTPELFAKFANALAGHREPIPLPPTAERYDYEAELAVVIGRRARYVTEAQALSCVLGYCNANDLSARDLQFRTSQWLLGKTLEKFLPIGPCIVTGDEVGEPQALRIRCWLNGELRQDASTADMVFGVAHLISYISQYLALEPGDVICTGTPEGVILGRGDRVWLKPGDEIVVEVEKLGRLVNTLVAGEGQALS
jgi:2-keto-4-pentenoate hydratase/2-oxohepta-3-ene-1,7-dioic acid hydratase in catechol pathway